MPRLFTIEEATALLPRLSEMLVEMQAAKPAVDALREQLDELTASSAGNGHVLEPEVKRKKDDAQRLVERLNELLAELNEIGCELKGLEEGLIDFQSERDGRTVYLCWKLGEEGIGYWHELDTGFAGRQPL
ncbi:MAG: DUF2203 domain-containing protein [Dehalococcoidia bacterium]